MNIHRGPLRADARANRFAILEAAVTTLDAAPRASMEDIAATAQVSRATMYAHFANREELVRAAFLRLRAEVDEQLAVLDPAESVLESLGRLVRGGWPVLGRFAGMAAVAGWEITPLELLIRGRQEGVFRADQTIQWQTECFYVIVRTGACQIREGIVTATQGADEMATTISAMLATTPEESAAGASAPRAPSVAPL